MAQALPDLKYTYYRSFVLFIIIPITIIMLVVLGILYSSSYHSARDKITLMHEAASSALADDVSHYSLQLANYLLTNNAQTLELAARYNLADEAERHRYADELRGLFDFLLLPEKNIIAVHFYMKDGGYYDLKGDLALPTSEIRENGWYRRALENPAHIYVDEVQRNIVYGMRDDTLSIPYVVAMPPGQFDRYNQVEMVCMYVYSDIPRMLNGYTVHDDFGYTSVVDNGGRLLFATGESLAGRRNANLTISTALPRMGWTLCSTIDEAALTGRFMAITALIFGTSALMFASFFFFSRTYLRDILDPLNSLIWGMERVHGGELDYQLPVAGKRELQELIEHFNTMTGHLRALLQQNEAEQREKYQAQIQALQAQINPHFLTNTLNSIRVIAMTSHFDNIRDMTQALIDILETTLQDPEHFHTLGKEMEVLKSYAYLMQVRHFNFFEVDYEIPEEMLEYKVPRLILQPLLENSILHGFQGIDHKGQVVLSAAIEDGNLLLCVEDNGRGMPAQRIREVLSGQVKQNDKRDSVGIYNVHRRLQLNYGEAYGITIQSEEGRYTRMIIRLPA